MAVAAPALGWPGAVVPGKPRSTAATRTPAARRIRARRLSYSIAVICASAVVLGTVQQIAAHGWRAFVFRAPGIGGSPDRPEAAKRPRPSPLAPAASVSTPTHTATRRHRRARHRHARTGVAESGVVPRPAPTFPRHQARGPRAIGGDDPATSQPPPRAAGPSDASAGATPPDQADPQAPVAPGPGTADPQSQPPSEQQPSRRSGPPPPRRPPRRPPPPPIPPPGNRSAIK